MIMQMKKAALILCYCLSTLILYGQKGTVSGKIMESPKKPLAFSTIAVYTAADTTLLSYRLSNPDGDFKIPALPLNIRLRLLITFSGYEAYRKEFQLSTTQPSLHFDSIYLKRTHRQLDEIMIFAELPPVSIRKDTIEFNASAFKTLPNALVEDLLKKLPGVEVDRDGNIAVEGKAVNRITVDGKTFFGDDPKMATRNLPANVIDKVQVTDDKEEMMRRGDDNPNNVGKVINLTFKKGVKKGWFGKLYAGAGSKDLYTAGGIGNIYRDTLQLSILGYTNNINKAPFSFSELLQVGGFQRNRSNSANIRTNVWRMGTGTGISLDNVNFGGAQGIGGISISKGAGFNLNHSPNKKRSFFLQYFYNNLLINKRELATNADQFKNDTVINTSSKVTGPSDGNRHNVAAGFRLKPDSVTNILINAAYMDARGIDQRLTNIATTNNKIGKLSSGNIDQKNDNKIITYKHNVSFSRLSKVKKGRRFTIGHNFDFRDTETDNFSHSVNRFIYPVTLDTAIQQLRQERVPTTEMDIYFNYSEPVSKKITIRFAARYDFLKHQSQIETFNYNSNSKSYDLFNALLTNSLHRKNNQLSSTAGLEYRFKDLTITPGIRLQSQKIINDISKLPLPLQQKSVDLLPTFSLTYKTFNFNYDRSVILPGYNYLIAVADNSNPYYITLGNPNLVSSVRDQVSINMRKNILKKQLTYGFNSSIGFTKNDVVAFVTVDSKGVFTNLPVNQSGGRNLFVNYFINKQYKRSTKFNLSLNHSAFFSNQRSRLLYNYESSWQNGNTLGTRIGFNMNMNDKLELISFYGVNYNFMRYKNPVFKDINQVFHTFENELILRYPKHFIWETGFQYWIDPYTAPGFPQQPMVWNAAINYTMLKNERGVLKFEVSDLLDKYQNISVNTQRNIVTTSSNNVLGRYFLLSFTYNVQTIGEKKKVGGWRLLLF